MTNADKLLTGPEAAARLGLTPATWRGYVSKGYAPKPDDADEGRPVNRRAPRWRVSTIDEFAGNRLGQGARTDRKAGR